MAPHRVSGTVKAAFLDDAEPAAVSHAVRDVLERRGALVSEHLHSRVRFRGLVPTKLSWSREGYVGIYQRTGEREVEVRLLLRATWPFRILWTVALFNVIAAILVATTGQSGTTWFVTAFVCAFALLVATILYVGTLKHVRAEERGIMDEFEAELQKDLDGASVLDEEARRLAQQEAELDAEIARRRLDKTRANEPRPKRGLPKFSLRPGKKQPEAPAEDAPVETSSSELEARRAELLRRKAELEARRQQQQP